MDEQPERIPEVIDEEEIELGGMTLKRVLLDNGERVYESETLIKFVNTVLSSNFQWNEEEGKKIVKFFDEFLMDY